MLQQRPSQLLRGLLLLQELLLRLLWAPAAAADTAQEDLAVRTSLSVHGSVATCKSSQRA